MTPRELTIHAHAAKLIRAELASALPGVTFKVRSRSYSGGNAVDVHWTDGPTAAQVREISSKYQRGTFNGMIDLYEYTNLRYDIPQVRFVQEARHYSDEATVAMAAWLNTRFGYRLTYVVKPGYRDNPPYLALDDTTDEYLGHGWASWEVQRYLQKLDLRCPACGAATLPGDRFCEMCGTAQPEIPLN